MFGLGFRLRPATHGWDVGVCMFVCLLPQYPATLGWGARRGCVCLGSGFGCAAPLLARVLGCACLCACPPCTPPLLAGVCGVCVCVWARVAAATRHSWLACWAVCVLVWALRLHPATPGWGARRRCVCLGSGFGCAPPLLAGVLSFVCAGVGAPLAPCHSWLGCAPCVCVFGLGFRLHPATPGWDVGLCVCWCGRFACTPPLLAGVCGVGVCVWARVSAAPCDSWLGCWGVCVLVCVLLLYPATPGWGVRCGCVCLGLGFGCALRLLAGVLGCVCAGVRAPPVPRPCWLGFAAWVCVLGLGFRLRPATPDWVVGLCVCSCARSACGLPLLAGVRGVAVCVWARVSSAPRHPWLGCRGVCVLVCVLLLYAASAGPGVWLGCVCLDSGFGCAPALLAWVLGCVCARVRALLAACHSWLGCVVWVCVFCLGSRLRPATPRWGLCCVGWLLRDTCLCAVVPCVLCALSGFVAPGGRRCLAPLRVPWLWPAACLSGVPRGPAWCAAPRPVRSLSVLMLAFLSPWCLSPPWGLAPPAILGGCAGHARAGREQGSLCLPLAPAEAGALGSPRVVPIRGPAMGLSLAGPSGVGLGLRALRWLACVDPVTDASGFPDRPSFNGGLGRCTGAVSCGS